MTFRLACALATFLMASIASGPSAAALLYSSGAPANVNGYNFANPSAADDFVLPSNAVVDGVRFWGYSNISGAEFSQIGWAIMSDASGLPGAVLFSGLATASSVVATGATLVANPNFAAFDVQFSISPAALSGGTTYWLALDSDPIFTNSDGGLGGWVFTAGAIGNISAYGGSTTWAKIPSLYPFDSAFQLSGSVPVPEPGTLALLGLGLAGLAATRRRKQ